MHLDELSAPDEHRNLSPIVADEINWRSIANDTLWVEIMLESKKKMVIGGVYRSPNNSIENNQKIWNTIKKITEKYKENVLIVGDFNCKEIDWKTSTTNIANVNNVNNLLLDTIRECYLHQSIEENTRARGGDTPSLIDLIFTYDTRYIENIKYLSPLGKSDHSVISLDYITKCQKKSYTMKKMLFDKASFDEIRAYLDVIEWDTLFLNTSVQQKWDIFDEKIKECEAKFIPTKMVVKNFDSKFKDILPQYVREKIKQKHNLWKRYMETRLSKYYTDYCRVRNKVKNMTKYFRKQKEKSISSNVRKNPKAFWKYAGSKINTTNSIMGLHINPKDNKSGITNDDKSKANILNDYFASVFTNEPDGQIPTLNKRTQASMPVPDIKESVVKHYLHRQLEVNKSPCPGGYHPKFLVESADQICKPLTKIFKDSLRNGVIPYQWKHARISAILKKGDKKLAGNYRPVSITSIICRLLEKIIRNSIVDFMSEYSLLSEFQFGFVKGRSTSLQLLKILNDWTESIENGKFSDCIYLDYQKAFDTVPHQRLLSKMKSYNISSNIIEWTKHYLSNRTQYVELNGVKSESRNVVSGIPQGSVLGPLLFLIYINDLPDNVKSTIYMYADDTKVYREIDSDTDVQTLQEDLRIMSEWSNKWLLKFHPQKCTSIAIGNENMVHSYELPSEHGVHQIEQVQEIKDIGVTVDSLLSFKQHIYRKIDTANKIIGIIRRSYKYLDTEMFIPLYKCLVRSHFDYAVTVWDPYILKLIDDIESVQRRATVLIPEIKKLSYSERLQKLGLPTLAYRRARGEMIEVFKIISNIYDDKVTTNILTMRLNNSNMGLRGHEYTLEQKRIYKPVCKNYFSNRVVKLWNKLPEHVIRSESLNTFKNRLDKLWYNQDLLTDYRSSIDPKKYPQIM